METFLGWRSGMKFPDRELKVGKLFSLVLLQGKRQGKS